MDKKIPKPIKKLNLLESISSLTSSKTRVFPPNSLIPSRPPLTRFLIIPPPLCFTVTRAFTLWDVVMVLAFLVVVAITTFMPRDTRPMWNLLSLQVLGKESLEWFKNQLILWLLRVSFPHIYRGKDDALLRTLIWWTCEFFNVIILI